MSARAPAALALLALLLGAGSGCAGFGYTGQARDLAPGAIEKEQGWVAVRGVPLYRQQGDHDCGPTALAMVMRYWDPSSDVLPLLQRRADSRSSAAELRSFARDHGFQAFVLEGDVSDVVHEIKAGRPVIVGVAEPTAMGPVSHYEVLIGLHAQTRRVALLDPALGLRQNSFEGFLREWLPTGKVLLVVMPPSEGSSATLSAGR